MILVIDNYDSFTFNLVQFIGELGAEPVVFRNDAISVDEIRARKPNGIIISPGPGRPESAGISIEVAQKLGGEIPILGVCLGHQAIAVAYGAHVGRAPQPIHGKTARVRHNGSGLFEGIDAGFEAGRYHSLVVDADSLPDDFQVSASILAEDSGGDDGLVMAIRHDTKPIYGVQFHPESILTVGGQSLLKNYLTICGEIS